MYPFALQGPYFESVISYLRLMLDAQTDRMTTEEKELCKQKFLETVHLEEEFFDNAFSLE
jgi:thiaminase